MSILLHETYINDKGNTIKPLGLNPEFITYKHGSKKFHIPVSVFITHYKLLFHLTFEL